MKATVHQKKLSQQNSQNIVLCPPWYIELGFYVSLFYGIMSSVLGVHVDRLGIVFLAGLACICFLGFRDKPLIIFKALVFPISLGISFLIIQMIYHGISIQSGYVKAFIPWLLTIIVVQALSFRTGFLHRFIVFTLLMGSVMMFFTDVQDWGKEGITRLSLEDGMGSLSNANALADWFGFCAISTYMLGVIAERQKNRIILWIISIACLFILTLTVSRGALLSCILAIVLGSREFLKRGFLPVLLLILIAWIFYVMGIFDQTFSFYSMRATEETGRSFIWPRAFQSFLNAPLTGVGSKKVYIFLPEKKKMATPHNGFLFIAMSSGIIPLIFYSAYWIQAAWSALLSPLRNVKVFPLCLPLVAYAFLACLFSNMTFMEPWVMVAIAATLTSSIRSKSNAHAKKQDTPKAILGKS